MTETRVWGLTIGRWTALGVIITATIGVITVLAWLNPVSTQNVNNIDIKTTQKENKPEEINNLRQRHEQSKFLKSNAYDSKGNSPSSSRKNSNKSTERYGSGIVVRTQNQNPVPLYCACKAEQTFCFLSESECQSNMADRGCVQKYSSITAFNIDDNTMWHRYGLGWVNETRCVIKERRLK